MNLESSPHSALTVDEGSTNVELPRQIEAARKALVRVNTEPPVFIGQHPRWCLAGAMRLGLVVRKIATRY